MALDRFADQGLSLLERDVVMDEIELRIRLERIECLLLEIQAGTIVRDWYSSEEFGASVGLSQFTVREHARLGRLHAKKQASGRGAHCSWVLSHDELLRYRHEGLLPLQGLRLKG